MEIYDFLEKYKDIEDTEENTIYEDKSYSSFEDSVYRKKEFYENRLSDIPETIKKGNLLNHQKFMANFLSSYTLYDEILLFHDPGTGKTCTSIAVIEKIKNEAVNIDGAIIITRGKKLIEQYIDQLLFDCTQGQYIPEDFDKLIKKDDAYFIKKAKKQKIKDYYKFYTFYEFSKKVSKMSMSERIKDFSNKIIVIDEIHNIKSDSREKIEEEIEPKAAKVEEHKFDVYKTIHEVLHQIHNRKIILMSGTPMTDKPEEISDVMNLILPLSNQLTKDFSEFFESPGIIKSEKIKKLKDIFKGRISYLKFMKTDEVKNQYAGEYNNQMTVFKTELTYMKDFQNKTYNDTMSGDQQGKGVYLESRQSSLFVFPDNTYGSVGFVNNIEETDKKGMAKYELKKQIKDMFKEKKTEEEKLKLLEIYSCKYAYLIRNLLNDVNKDKITFIYSSFVKGSGLIILCKFLEIFGFNQNFGKIAKSGPKGSYGVITGDTTIDEIKSVLSIFNNEDNKHGKNMRILIGSETISEGINLKNVQDIYILTPHWNFAETKQALSRGIRAFSHDDLKKESKEIIVNIHLLCSVPVIEGDEEDKKKSIDLIMYKTSEDKYKNIQLIENIIRESSVDCALNKKRNFNEEPYKCDNIEEVEELDIKKIDYSSYLFRHTSIYKKYVFQILEKTFLEKDFIELNNIIEEIYKINNDIDKEIVSKIVSIYIFELINSSQLFTNNKGDKGFLNQQENIIFLLKDKDSKNKSYIEYFYNENEYIKQDLNSKEVLQIIEKEYDNSLSIIKSIINSKKFENIILLSLYNQELVLEHCILSRVLKKDKNKDFVQYILKHYSNFIEDDEDTCISSLMMKDKNILRCLDSDNIWKNCNQNKLKSWIKKKEEKKEEKSINGISGIIIKGKDFKIKLFDKKECPGRTCKTFTMQELLRIIKKLEIPPPNPIVEEIIVNICNIKRITKKKCSDKIDKKKLNLEEGEDLDKIIIYLVDLFFEKKEIDDEGQLVFFKKKLVDLIVENKQGKDIFKKYELVKKYYEEEIREIEEIEEIEIEKLKEYITSKNIKEILTMSIWCKEKKIFACKKIEDFLVEKDMISYE
jgi:superfamily II DNA or RNA helicase